MNSVIKIERKKWQFHSWKSWKSDWLKGERERERNFIKIIEPVWKAKINDWLKSSNGGPFNSKRILWNLNEDNKFSRPATEIRNNKIAIHPIDFNQTEIRNENILVVCCEVYVYHKLLSFFDMIKYPLKHAISRLQYSRFREAFNPHKISSSLHIPPKCQEKSIFEF